MSGWQVHVFGVRHLSPMAAWHLRRDLDRLQPEVVLIEGLSDATPLISDITRKGTVPPIAILAYTDSLPVRTIVYPLAAYSPEYEALRWARAHKATAEFIDLPSEAFLGLLDLEYERFRKERDAAEAEPPRSPGSAESPGRESNAEGDFAAEAREPEAREPEPRKPEREPAGNDAFPVATEQNPSATLPPPALKQSIYERIAAASGEPDYETYWERHFEHNLSDHAYRRGLYEFGVSLREIEDDAPRWRAENLVREAYMRRRIEEVIASGVDPRKIVAVVGAFHASVIDGKYPVMTDQELAMLRKRASRLTLMPYSYFKLSSQSGYGAGNHAPAYYHLLWEALEAGSLPDLPMTYLSRVARLMRAQGTHRSTAEVIEGVRLARSLAAMKEGLAPTLRDLRDAATTLIGHGERSTVAEVLARVEVGTTIGTLPKGVSRTSIQSDFERELAELKLEKYRTAVKQDLALDLRENRRVKSESAAFLDLRRSSFLHRLRTLKIEFATLVPVAQDAATWAEHWHLQWTPEAEITLVEAVLLGETVELATAFTFKTALEQCSSVATAAALVNEACRCGLMDIMDLARQKLQELAALSADVVAVAGAARELSIVVRYGSVRRFDAAPLVPLIEELFVQGAILLPAAANCDNAAAQELVRAIDSLNQICLEFHGRVEEGLWVNKLRDLSDADDRNPVLSGYACAILLERGLLSNEELGREVSRRLSPGISADLGSGWFEGLSRRNRYALLARQPLWEQLAEYVSSLDDEQFRRALVFLRRAFGGFNVREKRQIAENLAQVWNVQTDAASELLEQPLTEQESQALEDLNDFDFGDL